MAIPIYMCKGSRGPLVNIVLSWLHGWEIAWHVRSEIVLDGELGDIGEAAIKHFQGHQNLVQSGYFDPPTMDLIRIWGLISRWLAKAQVNQQFSSNPMARRLLGHRIVKAGKKSLV